MVDYEKRSRKLSSEVVNYFRSELGYSLKAIGKLAGGLSESYMSRVGSGKRSFRLANLIALEDNTGIDLHFLIKRARGLT